MKRGLFNFLWTGFGTNVTSLRAVGMALICVFGVFFILYYGIRAIVRVIKKNQKEDPV